MNTEDTVAGMVDVERYTDVGITFDLPVHGELLGVELIDDTGFGFTGEPSLSIDSENYDPARVVLEVPEVLRDDHSPDGKTWWRMPAIELTIEASGPDSAGVTMRLPWEPAPAPSGSYFTSWFSGLDAQAWCWSADPPGPVLFDTTITNGSEPLETATSVHFDEDEIVDGQTIELRSTVDAPTGTVRFTDGEEILGDAEVFPNGRARLEVAISGVGDHEIQAEFLGSPGYLPSESEPKTLTVLPGFPDVPIGHEYFEDISWMAATDLSTGYDDGLFHPEATLTRMAMSAFIYRINGSPDGLEPVCETAPFNDVPTDHAFCGEIAWMKATGISEGYEGNLYKPSDGLTRQAMSAFLYRSANPGETPPPCLVAPFPDVPTDNPFCSEITWMADTGISTGFDNGARYEPNLALTRMAMSAFLFRYTLVVPTEL